MKAPREWTLWAVEFSPKKAVFRMCHLSEVLKRNMSALDPNERLEGDYIPVGFAESHQEAAELLTELKALHEGFRQQS